MKKIISFLSFGILLSFNSFSQVSVYGASSGNNCDGTAILDSAMFENASTINWLDVTGNSIGTDTDYLTGLCSGDYSIVVTASNGTTTTYLFTVDIDITTDPCSNFVAAAIVTNTTDSNCDGSISVSTTGGTAPFNYEWYDMPGNTNEIATGLCEGYTTCFITDANGCETAIMEFVYADITTDPFDSTMTDVIVFTDSMSYPGTSSNGNIGTFLIEDCVLDYSSPVSGSIFSYSYLNDSTVNVNWNLYDADGNVISTYSVDYDIQGTMNGVFDAVLIVFCETKAINAHEIHINDQIQLNINELGVAENSKEWIQFINPFTDQLKVSFIEVTSGSILIMDLFGKIVLSNYFKNENSISLNTLELNEGSYIMMVNVNNKTKSFKIIK